MFPIAQSTVLSFTGPFAIAYPHFQPVSLRAVLLSGDYEAQCWFKWLPWFADLGLCGRRVPSLALLCQQNLPDSDEKEIKWRDWSCRSAPRLLVLCAASPSPDGVWFWVIFLQKGDSPHGFSPENPGSAPSSPRCEGITAAE